MKTRINIILALVFAVSTGAYSQTTFTKCAIPEEEVAFSKDLETHVKSFSHSIQRDKSLDSLAEIRVNYFVSVLQETSKQPGTSLRSIIGDEEKKSKIPGGEKGHDRYFGDPLFFKEPSGCRYPIWNPKVTHKHIKVNAEIFQTSGGITFRREYSNAEIEVVKKYLQLYKTEYTKRYLINNYLNSYDHAKAIRNQGDGKYGMCTRVLVSKKWDNVEKVWVYELVIFNLVVFSDPV
jgi:hypothetical protein